VQNVVGLCIRLRTVRERLLRGSYKGANLLRSADLGHGNHFTAPLSLNALH
jgi:hypothetical protein